MRRWPSRRRWSTASSSSGSGTTRRCRPAAIIGGTSLMAKASADCPAEPLDSETPLFILYTSGSTGKPKGIKHTTAGYNLFVKKTFQWVFDYRDEDIFWCTADCGWVTGHSYIVYGPLSAGATVADVRRGPELAARRPLLGHHRAVSRQHSLHGADGDSRVHQVGRSARRQARSVEPAAARARSAKGSIPKRGCGITARSAASVARSSIRGGRPKRAAS